MFRAPLVDGSREAVQVLHDILAELREGRRRAEELARATEKMLAALERLAASSAEVAEAAKLGGYVAVGETPL